MTRDIVIIGCGGFGREVADIVEAINALNPSEPAWNLLGFLDDSPSHTNLQRIGRQGHRYIGPVDPNAVTGRPSFVVGINDGDVRRILSERMESVGWTPATLIHPWALVGSDCRIGEGTILCAGAKITTNVSLGRHVQLNPNSTVGHDTEIRDFVSVNPLAAVSGEIVIGECSVIGSASFVLQGLNLSDHTVVGASACVVRSTTEATVLIGVPARPMKEQA